MRIVRINKNLVGKTVARTVYAADGRVLLAAGAKLTPVVLDGLIRWGYNYVAIEDQLLKDMESSDAISDITRLMATSAVQTSLARAEMSEPIDSSLTQKVVDEILKDIQSNKNVVVSLSAVRGFDDYTFVHCVNVCVLSILLGQALEYHRFNLTKLAAGALLHDIGKVRVPATIINKPGKLTQEEFEIVKTHPSRGFEMLAKSVSYVSAHVALQHHERMDGSGYPRGLQEDSIHEFGKVAMVADVYDALTSDRPYRPALSPMQAMVEMGKNPKSMEPGLVEHLRKRLAMFWEGSIVVLNDRRVAVVLKQTDETSRPVVRVVSTKEGRLAEPIDLDLREKADLRIMVMLNDYPDGLKEEIEKNYNK